MSLYIIIIISNNVSKILKYYLKDLSDLNLVLIIKHENYSLILQFVFNFFLYIYFKVHLVQFHTTTEILQLQ